MSDPSRTEIINQLKYDIAILEELWKAAASGANCLLARQDTLTQNQEGDFASDCLSAVKGIRASVNSALTQGRSLCDPHIKSWGRYLKSPEKDTKKLLARYGPIWDDMIAESDTVESRAIAAPTDATTLGTDGLIWTAAKDADDYNIENIQLGTTTFTITQDQNSGATKNNEQITYKGKTKEVDDIVISGSGIETQFNLQDNSLSLTNMGFESDLTASTIPGWTLSGGDISYFSTDTTDIYLPNENGIVTKSSLKITPPIGGCVLSITKPLVDEGPTFNNDAPYAAGVHFYGPTASGSYIKTKLGSASGSCSLATSPANWGRCHIVVSGTSTNWFKSFNQDDLEFNIEIVLASGSGPLYIDDSFIQQFTTLDGVPVCARPGRTPQIKDDSVSITRSVTKLGVIQEWLWRLWDAYLPHSGAPSIADPT